MKKANQDFNEQDVMFVRMMIEHHGKALKMATEEWHMGSNEEMKNAALEMFGAQKAEIEKMRKWMMDRGVSEMPEIDEMPMKM